MLLGVVTRVKQGNMSEQDTVHSCSRRRLSMANELRPHNNHSVMSASWRGFLMIFNNESTQQNHEDLARDER